MKKILCICTYLIVSFSFKTVSADGTNSSLSDGVKIEHYVSSLYNQIDFSQSNRLSYDVFSKAYRGYLNLRNEGKVNREKEIISVCDFSLPSTEKRMWIIDLAKKKVIFNTYVAHGQGSGEDGNLSFSNKNSTHKSSLGFYVTGDTYEGEHGTSLHLFGMDEGFNDAAFDRGIVVHGAKYVCEGYINQKDRLGRSWGCPAVPAALSLPIINTIKDSTCLFIYYPEAKYLKTAYWLNKKVDCLPESNLFADMQQGATKPSVKVIEYIHNGKVDSTKTIPLSQ